MNAGSIRAVTRGACGVLGDRQMPEAGALRIYRYGSDDADDAAFSNAQERLVTHSTDPPGCPDRLIPKRVLACRGTIPWTYVRLGPRTCPKIWVRGSRTGRTQRRLTANPQLPAPRVHDSHA